MYLVELTHECTVIVGTTALFVAHKYGFSYTFKEWEQNPRTLHVYSLTVLHFDFHSCFQEQIMYKSQGLLVILCINVHTCVVSCGRNWSWPNFKKITFAQRE